MKCKTRDFANDSMEVGVSHSGDKAGKNRGRRAGRKECERSLKASWNGFWYKVCQEAKTGCKLLV
ncbi:hypothetical protein [Endozoicomonas sp. YOMI1]|uniref:hypothetical protein n=1 Tax=Endozoicomonas sp. YOMI1 TaxID=2828739 RepID=UPI0021474129|nr:hypothetical protein [Endozoicomonas sp. YOMI1]